MKCAAKTNNNLHAVVLLRVALYIYLVLADKLIKIVNGLNPGVHVFGSLSSVIVRASVVLKRTVGDSDLCFDNLSSSHLQSYCDIVPSVHGIYVSGY